MLAFLNFKITRRRVRVMSAVLWLAGWLSAAVALPFGFVWAVGEWVGHRPFQLLDGVNSWCAEVRDVCRRYLRGELPGWK